MRGQALGQQVIEAQLLENANLCLGLFLKPLEIVIAVVLSFCALSLSDDLVGRSNPTVRV